MDATVVPGRSAVQQVAQCQQRGGLTRLPRRVQDEVAPLSDQRQDLSQIDPVERRYAIVLFGTDRTRRVEIAHGGNFARADGAGNTPAPARPVLSSRVGRGPHPPYPTNPTTNAVTTPTQIPAYSGTNFCLVLSISGCVTGFPANFPRGFDGKKNVLYVSRVATV